MGIYECMSVGFVKKLFFLVRLAGMPTEKAMSVLMFRQIFR